MAVWALGINHNTAPVDIRGRFAFALDQIAPTLQSLRSSISGVHSRAGVESAILSTCNRTEIYCAANEPALDHTLRWLAQSGNLPPEALQKYTYTLQDGFAARQQAAGQAYEKEQREAFERRHPSPGRALAEGLKAQFTREKPEPAPDLRSHSERVKDARLASSALSTEGKMPAPAKKTAP